MSERATVKKAVAMKVRRQLSAPAFVDRLLKEGFEIGSGVPCSWLSPLTNALLNHSRFRYIPAVQEGDAVAIAAGADLGGRRALVAFQNSGLTNAGSPLTSYNYPFRRGVLMFVSWRGEPGLTDEPQHELLGQITERQMSLWKISHETLETDGRRAHQQLVRASRHLEMGQSYALLVGKDTFTPNPIEVNASIQRAKGELTIGGGVNQYPTRREALKKLLVWRKAGSILLATTGYTGRELFELGDAPNQVMMVGSMGCVSSLGLGLAIARPRVPVIAIDGDGALLMRLGSLATNAWRRPNNLLHILLDNMRHESTGGQATASSVVSFPNLALAAGYPHVVWVHTLKQFEEEIARWHNRRRLTFLYLAVRSGVAANLSRPKITPAQVADRLRTYLNDD